MILSGSSRIKLKQILTKTKLIKTQIFGINSFQTSFNLSYRTNNSNSLSSHKISLQCLHINPTQIITLTVINLISTNLVNKTLTLISKLLISHSKDSDKLMDSIHLDSPPNLPSLKITQAV